MKYIEIPTTYDSPELVDSNKIHLVLNSAIQARGQGFNPSLVDAPIYWPAEHFGLDRVFVFKNATLEVQQKILALATRETLTEAYFIEKSGMSFTAKMALLARTTQERMLYSLFSADETLHLNLIASHMKELPDTQAGGPFISLLSEMIQHGDRESLVMLIQVVLEGWGITHYQKLAENCLDSDLKQKLKSILKDEARHHGSGMILSKEAELNETQEGYVIEILSQFLEMVRVGPQTLLRVIEAGIGVLTTDERTQVLSELKAVEDTQTKLDLIRDLLIHSGGQKIFNRLSPLGLFSPRILT